jgi:hypothetical protein
MFLLMWLTVEGISLIAYFIVNRQAFSYADAAAQLSVTEPTTAAERALTAAAGNNWNGLVEVLHPYFGIVGDPRQSEPMWDVSEFGFLNSGGVNPILKRSPDKVIVALFGGSFAGVIYPSLKQVVEQHGIAANKTFVVMNFAAGGYKQPQQLMILSYLLAAGAEFDLVLNVDGFNEVTLPPVENIPNGVHPFYPRSWDKRTATVFTTATLRLIGQVEVTKQTRRQWARRLKRSRLYASPTLFLAWQSWDRILAGKVSELNRQLASIERDSSSFMMHGPRYTAESHEQLFRDLADLWKNASIQMKALCDAHGAGYYHFLQPNQYIEGSKPMGEAERKIALNEASPYGKAAALGYPFLWAAGSELEKAGVQFIDLTRIFSDHPEMLYIDDCCHTNAAGSAVVTEHILRVLDGASVAAPPG